MIRKPDFWRQLDVRHLASFRAVVDTRSFNEAARELGYTQSAVSQQIAALERILGHQLLARDRGRGGVKLTPAGELFARHAALTLARLAAARADLDALAEGDVAAIRVGAFQSVSARVIPDLINRLANNDARVDVRLTESEHESELLGMIDAGALDFAFTLLPVDRERYTSIELLEDPFYLVGSEVHRERLSIEQLRELADTPIVAPRTCRTWQGIEGQLAVAGVSPNYAFRTDDNFTLSGLLQSGIGVAFVSGLTLGMMSDDLHAVSVAHLIPPRRLALVWSAYRTATPAHARFIEFTRELSASLGADG